MPPRKHKRETSPIRIDSAARARLDTLKSALASQGMPSYVDLSDAVSAIVMYTTPEQLAGMLAAYWRSTQDLPIPPGGAIKSP